MGNTKIVKVRLPVVIIERVKKAAKLAGITPTQAFNLLVALDIVGANYEHGTIPHYGGKNEYGS